VLEGTQSVGLASKVILTIEVVLLLMVAGNSMGAWATTSQLRGSAEREKRRILRENTPPSDTTQYFDQLEKMQSQLAGRATWYYRNAYATLLVALLLAVAGGMWIFWAA
jgi:hypothetical protein